MVVFVAKPCIQGITIPSNTNNIETVSNCMDKQVLEHKIDTYLLAICNQPCVLYYAMCFYVTVVNTEMTLCHNVLLSLMKDPTTHDVTFKTADGGSLGAHRAIIAASSPVFHAMLYSKTRESKESEIHLSSTNIDMLKMMFTFIYTGVVQVNSNKCLSLLQAAHYFNIATLEAKCSKMLVDSLDVNCNFSSIITFAVEHQLDLLIKQCFEFMEINADKVIHSLEFTTLPLSMILAFVKSSNLEVREVDLFLAVANWFRHQENVLSADDKKQLFQLIRYPLISLNDLLEEVKPSKLADQNLYTAALEYHNMDMSKIRASDFSQDQLTVRKYYFNFLMVPGLLIEHARKGTVISVTDDSNDGDLYTMAEIFPTEKPVRFEFSTTGLIGLEAGYINVDYDYCRSSISYEGNKEGSIMLNDGFLITKIENDQIRVPMQNKRVCVMRIYIHHGDRFVIKRL